MTDTMSDDLTIGEIGRSVARIEATVTNLSGQMQTAIAPVTELKVRVERCESDINGLGVKIENVNAKADAIKTRADRASGAAALLAFLSGFASWLVGHK